MNITFLPFIYSVLLLVNGRYFYARNDGIDRSYPGNLKDVNIAPVAKTIDGADTAKVWFKIFVKKFIDSTKCTSYQEMYKIKSIAVLQKSTSFKECPFFEETDELENELPDA